MSDQEIQDISLSQNEKRVLTAEQQLTRSMQMERVSPEHGAVPLTDQHDQDTLLSQNDKSVLTAKNHLTNSIRRERDSSAHEAVPLRDQHYHNTSLTQNERSKINNNICVMMNIIFKCNSPYIIQSS